MNKKEIIKKLNEILDLLEPEYKKYHIVQDWFTRINHIKLEIILRDNNKEIKLKEIK